MYQQDYFQLPSIQASLRARVNTYVVPLLIAAHVIAFSISATSGNFPAKSFAHVLLGMIFSCVAACTTLLYARSNVPKFIAAFVVATCTLKLPICLIVPETTFLEAIPLDGKLLAEVVCAKFFWFSVGFMGYALGAIFGSRFFWNMSDPAKRDSQLSMPEKGFVLLLILYCIVQVMRAFLLIKLKIGAPNVVSQELLIPKLSGILNIVGTRGLLILVSGLLAWSLARKSYLALFVSALAALTYAGVEMAGGWRSGLYYYGLCGSWVFLASEPSKLKNRLKPFAIGFVVLAFLMFVPVMDYRHNINRGMSQGEAVRAVLEGRQDDERNLWDKIHKIIRRFNGIDLYIVASHGSQDAPMGAMSLLNGSASKFFTFGLLGTPDEAVTTQGITYWGAIAIAIGDQWLAPAGFVLGAVVGGLPIFCRRWFYSPIMRSVYECNVTIVLLAATMGNGAFPLYAKELLISFLMCMLYKLVVTTDRPHAIHTPQQQLHYP